MYLNICHDASRRSWQGFLCTCWRRMMTKISVNYITSKLMRSNPKFPGLLSQKELTSTIRTDLQNLLDLCCFSQALFFSPVIYIFIRADRSLTSFNFFSSSRLAAREWAVMCRTLQHMTLAGEKYAERALWFGSVGINFASAAFTHSLSHPPPLLGFHPLTVALPHFHSLAFPSLFLHCYKNCNHVLQTTVTGPQRTVCDNMKVKEVHNLETWPLGSK